jgi:hypothetical protein
VPLYILARIGIVPLTLLFTAMLNRTSYSIAVLSSSLTATLNLLIATSRPAVRVTGEGIVAGVFSSFFVALTPILLTRTHRTLASSLAAQHGGGSDFPYAALGTDTPTAAIELTNTNTNTPNNNNNNNHNNRSSRSSSSSFSMGSMDSNFSSNNYGGNHDDGGVGTGTSGSYAAAVIAPAQSRAAWLLLHYLGLLALALLAPLVALSGELGHMGRNCYILDLPVFWCLALASGAVRAAAVVFAAVLLPLAASPLAAAFLPAVPCAAAALLAAHGFRGTPAHRWVGVGLALLASAWFVVVRVRERAGPSIF